MRKVASDSAIANESLTRKIDEYVQARHLWRTCAHRCNTGIRTEGCGLYAADGRRRAADCPAFETDGGGKHAQRGLFTCQLRAQCCYDSVRQNYARHIAPRAGLFGRSRPTGAACTRCRMHGVPVLCGAKACDRLILCRTSGRLSGRQRRAYTMRLRESARLSVEAYGRAY